MKDRFPRTLEPSYGIVAGLALVLTQRAAGAALCLTFEPDLRTPTRTPAIQALVAGSVADHDRAAVRAGRRVLLVAERGGVAGVRAVGILWRRDDRGGAEGGDEGGVGLGERSDVGNDGSRLFA